jgi:fibronectin-binding autotransporter adhesin
MGGEGGELVADEGTTFNIPGEITGSGALKFSGGGTLQLRGDNAYTNRTLIAAGTVEIGADSNLGAAPGSPLWGHLQFETTDWARLRITNSFTMHANRGIGLNGVNADIEVVAGQTFTYNGIIDGIPSDFGSLSKLGAGRMVLGGQNQFTNVLFINNGEVELTDTTDPLDTLWIDIGDDISPDSPEVHLILGDGVSIDNQVHSRTNANDSTTGDRYIMMQEAGAAELQQGVRISDTLAISNVSGSTLTFSGAIWQNATNETTGDQRIRKLGAGVAVFNNGGFATKYLDVEDGTAQSGLDHALARWTDLNVSEGALYDMADHDLTVALALGDGTIDTGSGAGGTLFIYKGYNMTSLVEVTGNGGFTKSGAEDGEFWDFTLKGTNNYTGPTKIEHGTLRIFETTNIGSGNIIIETSATLRCEADMTFDSSRSFTMTDHGQIAVMTGNTVVVDGIIGGVNMSFYGDGGLVLNNENTFSGSFYVNEGTVSVTSADPFDCTRIEFGPDSEAWNTTLDIGAGSTVDVPMTVNANGVGQQLQLIRNTSAGDAVYSGEILIEDSVQLSLENTGGGTLTLHDINNNASKSYLWLNNNTVNIVGDISNDAGAGFDKRGGGTIVLTNTSTFSGGLYIVGGTVVLGNTSGHTLSACPVVFLGESGGAYNATLGIAGGANITNRVESRHDAAGSVINSITKNSSGDSELSGELTMAYGLTANNSFRIDNSAGGEMLFSGPWNLNGDQRGVQVTGDIRVTGTITNGSGATYNGLVKRGDGTMEIDGILGVNLYQDQGNVVIGSNCTFAGVDTYYLGTRDNEDYDQDDTFLTFQEAQTFTNGITVGTMGDPTGTRQINFVNPDGTVEISGAITLGTNASRYLILSNDAAHVELSGNITGDGGLIKQGAGTIRFSANATYSDLTRVEEGTLLLDAITNTASMIISNGAVLAGQGSVGAITNAGALGPALDNAPGTLKCTSLEFDNDSQFNCAITASGNDLLDVEGGGDVTFNGTVILNITNLGNGSLFQNMTIIDYAGGSSVGSPVWVITGDVSTAMSDYITVTNDLGDYWYIKGANPECNITNGAPAVGDDLEISLEVSAVEGMSYDLIYVDAVNYSDSLSNNWQYLYTETATADKITFTNNLIDLSLGYLRFLRVSPLSAWSNNVGKYASRQIYVGKRVRLYPGRNWVAPPSFPATPTVSNVFGYNLPAGDIDNGTMVYLYDRGVSIAATGSVRLASGTSWIWQTGGTGAADNFEMPIDQGFMVDLPSGTMREFALVGALRTNTQSIVIAGGDALTFVSVLLPRNMHPSDLGLINDGFTGSYRISRSDQLYIWDRVNQRIKYNMFLWYDTNDMRWEWSNNSAVTGTPISQDDALLIYTQGAGYTWENGIYYTPPTQNMTP